MLLKCPNCLSTQVETKDYAKKAAATVGFLGGAAGGVASAKTGSEIGSVLGGAVGCIAGPVGSRIGRWIGALVGGMVGGVTGALTGAQIGQVIDERLLNNYHCLACDHNFSSALAFNQQETENALPASEAMHAEVPLDAPR